MIPEPITIDGRTGTIIYLNAQWHPVPVEQATAAKVVFDDGGVAFYTTQSRAEKREYVREPAGTDEGGQFAETGHTGEATPDPRLAAEAKAGVAAVEKLIPLALSKTERKITNWEELDPYTKTQVYREWIKTTLAEHSQMNDDDAGDQWEELSEDEKLGITVQYVEEKKIETTALDAEKLGRKEPETWVTGIEETAYDSSDLAQAHIHSSNYDRTHDLALKLVELRTDEIRKERGLLPTVEKPFYEIVEGFNHRPERPNYVIKDIKGEVVGASSTIEQATINAEEWAAQELKNAGVVDSKTLIAEVWDQWKGASGSGLALSLQLAAARELKGDHRLTEEELSEAKYHAERFGGIETLQAYVRAQWEVTQMVMQKAGESKISVYRGLMLAGEQVDQTRHDYTDKLGNPVGPPTNITTREERVAPELDTPDKPPLKVFVAFDFNGEHFVVEKQRGAGGGEWDDVDEAIQKKVAEAFVADVKEKTREAEHAMVLHSKFLPGEEEEVFNRFHPSAKYQLLVSYAKAGKIFLPIESDEAAIKRRLKNYESSQQNFAVNPNLLVKLPLIQLQRAGAQSTTSNRNVANSWQGVGGQIPANPVRVVLRIEAPATSVLSIPVFGANVQAEQETVIVGTKDKWLWDAWTGKAPAFESQAIVRKAEMKSLVIDLQAEDRGKPHWMSSVDWAAIKQPSSNHQAMHSSAGKFVKSYAEVLKWEESKHPRQPKGSEQGGEFASASGGDVTQAMITSQRPPGDVGHQPNKVVFQHMRAFAKRLQKIPGVSGVSVKPGVGGWEGGSEAMWQVSYRGNGEAERLMARTAKAFNQDSVLILRGCGAGAECQPSSELSFPHGVSGKVREEVHTILAKHGISGWTWGKRAGHTVLRMVAVPQWGNDPVAHEQATATVSEQFRQRGLTNTRQVKQVAVSVMEREGVNSYDRFIRSST